VKAQHIRKIRVRLKRSQELFFAADGVGDHDSWVSNLASLIGPLDDRRSRKRSMKERQAEASAVWYLFFSDIPGVLDALIEANQEIAAQRRQLSAAHAALRRHGIDLAYLTRETRE
jgi:hypothetical protein